MKKVFDEVGQIPLKNSSTENFGKIVQPRCTMVFDQIFLLLEKVTISYVKTPRPTALYNGVERICVKTQKFSNRQTSVRRSTTSQA